MHKFKCKRMSSCRLYTHTNADNVPLKQWFPTTFLEDPRHCMFSLSPQWNMIQIISSLVETPRPELDVSDKGKMQKVHCWGGLREHGWEPLQSKALISSAQTSVCQLYSNHSSVSLVTPMWHYGTKRYCITCAVWALKISWLCELSTHIHFSLMNQYMTDSHTHIIISNYAHKRAYFLC